MRDPTLEDILARRGATCVQLDEPSFTGDRTPAELAAFEQAYQRLSTAPLRPRLPPRRRPLRR